MREKTIHIILVCDSKVSPLDQVTGTGRGTENVKWTANLVPSVEFYNPTLIIIKDSVSFLLVDIWRH